MRDWMSGGSGVEGEGVKVGLKKVRIEVEGEDNDLGEDSRKGE